MSDSDSIAGHHGNPDGMQILANLTRLPNERIEYHAISDTSVIADIKCGILFIMAFWSAPSVKAFGQLTEIVKRFDPNGRLQFVVVDTDGARPFYDHPQFVGKIGGWGETAWIKDGEIQSTSGSGYNPSCFEPNTKALLETHKTNMA